MIIPAEITIGPIVLHFYGLMYAAGAVAAYFLTLWFARARGDLLSGEAIADVIFRAMLLGVIGGRLFYVIVYNPEYFLAHPGDIIAVWQGGMSIHGGLLGGFLGAWWSAKVLQRPLLELADLFMPALALGLAFGRFGNFVNAELVGRITDVPWGVDFGDGETRHPSQLYAMAKDLTLCLILLLIGLKYRPRAGVLTGLFFTLLALFRFVVEFFRAPDPQLGLLALGLSMGQWLSVLLFLIGLGILIFSLRQKSHR